MRKFRTSVLSLGILSLAAMTVSCSGNRGTKAESDTADAPEQAGKPVIDKSGDSTLQAMIKEVAPKFKQMKYIAPESGAVIEYNLYEPENVDTSKEYPLVMFVADASTAGKDVKVPLTQGYGALVWATPESQAKNPCYVLVPQMSEVAVDDAYTHTQQVDDLIGLVKQIENDYAVDDDRIYSTGQSMGGMMSMYYDVAYPDLFAASIFVDSHWDAATFPELVEHKFVWFIAGDKGKAYPKLEALEAAARQENVSYTFTSWSAKLPQAEQNQMAAVMLEKGAPVNIFEFETGTVLPEGVEAPDHMYSFDYAYKNAAVRDWLFQQKK